MGKFKKLIAFAAALALSAAIVPASYAAIPQYAQGLTETFDYGSVDELLANSDVISNITNRDTCTTLTLDSTSVKSGTSLAVKSAADGDSTVVTKNILNYDVTVVDFQLRGSASSSGLYARIELRDNTTYTSSGKAPLLSFENSSNTTVLQDFLPASHVSLPNWAADRWFQVRLIFDRPNKTITLQVPGSSSVYTSSKTFDKAWDDNAYLTFQSVRSAMLRLDDIIVSDGFYLNNVYIDQDFEHPRAINSIGYADQPKYFPLVTSNGNIDIVYDSALNNTYASIPASRTLYSNATAGITPQAGEPVVIEYSLKTDTSSTVTPEFNQAGNKLAFAKITNGIAATPQGNVNVSDGAFHTYRITLTRGETSGYTASLLIDNVWRGNYTGTFTPTGGRFEFVTDSASSAVGLDNFRIYYPTEPAVLSSIEDGAENVAVNSAIVLKGNNPLNYSSLSLKLTTDDGEAAAFTTNADSANNTLTVTPTGGLEPNTTYTLTIPSTAKDMFDQYFAEQTITFTTEAIDPVEASLSYTINGEEVEDNKFYNGDMQITLDVKANTSAGANLFAAAAQYDSDGNLINVASVNSVFTGKGADSKTDIMTITQTEGTTIRLFCWEADTLTPLLPVVNLTVSN